MAHHDVPRRPALKPLLALLGLLLLPPAESVPANTVEPKSVTKIFTNGQHNAFTALIGFKGAYYLAFRTAPSHAYGEADIVLLRSADTRTWTEARRFNILPDDRDPQFIIVGERLLMFVHSLQGPKLQVYVVSTTDGEKWSEPQPVGETTFSLWKPFAHEGKYHATSYKKAEGKEGGKIREVRLVESADGIDWKKVSTIRAGNWESETTVFPDGGGQLTGFLRTKYRTEGDIIESSPPYAEWKQRPAGTHFSGHCVHRIDGVTYLLSRSMDESGKNEGTAIYTYADGKLSPYSRLPSGGECSYPEVVVVGDEMVISYYSSHEGTTDIYLARVPLTRAPATGG